MATNLTTLRVAAEVRAEMARKRRTQFDLAELLGTSQTSISRRLKGDVEFDVTELLRVAAFLDVPVSQFLPEVAA